MSRLRLAPGTQPQTHLHKAQKQAPLGVHGIAQAPREPSRGAAGRARMVAVCRVCFKLAAHHHWVDCRGASRVAEQQWLKQAEEGL
jgi:hypothetical protein